MLEKGVSVPKVIQFEDANPFLGRSFMITSEIQGVRTDKDVHSSTGIIVEAGRQLALINSISVERFGWIDRSEMNVKKLSGTFGTWEEFALDLNNIHSQLSSLAKTNAITPDMVKKVITYIEANRGLISCPQAFLSHGDFDVTHIFSVNGKYSGIIDFGDIRCCSPYHDLAHFYTYSRKQFDNLLKGFLEVSKLEDHLPEKIKFEALLFGIGKLWYTIEHFPEKFNSNHPAMSLITNIV